MSRFFLFLLLCCASVSANAPKIAIVGAGLAGLTAGYRLQQMGHPCVIYEACGRPGGRVLTAYFGKSYDELGGKNVYDGGDGVHILSLIEEMGLKTQDNFLPIIETSYYVPLESAPYPSLEAFMDLKKQIPTSNSLADLVAPFFAESPSVRKCMQTIMTGWEGSPPDELAPEYLDISFWKIYKDVHDSIRNFALGKPYVIHQRSVSCGNSKLIEALASQVQIHYNMPLLAITRDKEGAIWLHFDRECIRTDYLILTIPCTTLCDVSIQESLLPEDQLQAIRTLQYGSTAKILFPVTSSLEDPPAFIQLSQSFAALNNDRTMMNWCGGGTFSAFDENAIESDMAYIHQNFPHFSFPHGIVPTKAVKESSQYEQPIALNWKNEKYSKGAYSNYAPGTFEFFNTFITEHGESVRKVFRSVDNQIFFAGEHTAPLGDNGTMDGAVNSGARAARILNKILKEK